MKIYNLYPTLAGTPDRWREHARRACSLGFDWIILNPFHASGSSGSLYSIRDPYRIHEKLDPDGSGSPDPVFAFIRYARSLGLRTMVDLALTRMALEAPLVAEHPDWFRREPDGAPGHPTGTDAAGIGKIWDDQIEIAAVGDGVAPGLLEEWRRFMKFLIDGGVAGFKFERPDRIPPAAFAAALRAARDLAPDIVLVAETLGLPPEVTERFAASGVGRIYNSSKFWDGASDWCLLQHDRTRRLCPSISFPETHATGRLMADCNGDVRLVKQRLVLAAFFSASLLVPIGFEYGHRKRLDAMTTTPADWEGVHVDLTSFVRRVNNIKSAYGALSCEGRVERLSADGDPVLMLRKSDPSERETALLLVNTDPWSYHPAVIEDLRATMNTDALVIDVSPEYPVDGQHNNYQYYLKPTQTKLFWTMGRDRQP